MTTMRLTALPAMAGLVCILGAGCAERPIAVSPPIEGQAKIETLAHWDDVAEAHAAALVQATARQPALRELTAARPFYVRPLDSRTAFGRAYYDLLRARLLEKGARLAETRDGAIVVNTTVQAIKRPARAARVAPGPLTALAGLSIAGLELADGFGDGWAITGSLGEYAGILGLSAIVDVLRLPQPASEIVITTSIVADRTPIFQKTGIYYVREETFREYVSTQPQPIPTPTQSSEAQSRAVAVRSFPVAVR